MQSAPAFATSHSGIFHRNRALGFASVATSGPRKLLQNLLHWKLFKLPVSTSTSTNRTSHSNGTTLSPARQAGATDSHGRPSAGGARNVGIVWFRSDLRLHDNEALTRANAECTSLLPVYCFDPRDYGSSPLGYDRTGPYRASFLIEAVQDLRSRLQAAGSQLLVRIGRPEEVLAEVARKVGASAVYCHSEVSTQDCQVELKVAQAIEATGAKLKTFWGNTLHHVEDLPFKLLELPQNFDRYKAQVSAVVPRSALAELKELRGMPLGGKMDIGELPTLKDLGLAPLSSSSSSGRQFTSNKGRSAENICRGGESEALKQLEEFLTLAKADHSSSSSQRTRSKASYGNNFSNKIAPWLATGCLSPRRMLEDVKQIFQTLAVDRKSGDANISAASTSAMSTSNTSHGMASTNSSNSSGLQWIEFELLWRDFFRLLAKKSSHVVVVGNHPATVAGAQQHQQQTAPVLAMA